MALRPPGRWGREEPAKPANEVITDSVAEQSAPGVSTKPVSPAARSRSASARPPYQEAIATGVAQGRNARAIWQDLVDRCGFAAGYQSVPRYVRKLQPSAAPEACAIIQTAAGEEAQVDYGEGPMVRDPHSGKYRRMRLFVLTLGYRRKCGRLLVFRSSAQIRRLPFETCHIHSNYSFKWY